MAESKDNYVMHGMSGKLGNLLVFKQWFGKTIASKKPRKSGVAATVKQLQVQEKFQRATVYAKAAIADPATKQAYENNASPGQTAFNLAFADFFIAPTIDEIDHVGYTGVAGDKIKIEASDDFKVTSVDVTITKANGTLVEQGPATADPDGVHWWYTATQANASLSGTKITAAARDLPANVTVMDEIIP